VDVVGTAEFFQGDGDFPTIGGRGGIKIDHGDSSVDDDNLHV
jgi:hypothetical protein